VTQTTNPYRLSRAVLPEAYRISLTPNLDAASFAGRVEIDVNVHEAVSSITLNAIELTLGAATLTSGGTTVTSATPTLDETYETATFAFAAPLPEGPATLAIEFTGTLNDQLHGFYRSTYTDGDGTAHTIATTQFESTDARRAFPCFDEPAMKATYQVTLTIPQDLSAYSNSAELDVTDNSDGTRTIEFAPTMKMSTYLVAFVVGPFEATDPVDVGGTDVRVIYPKGKGHLTAFPLEVAQHALGFFSEYFDIEYPGDKFDLIAIPDFAAGAMENLGLVTFREADLLIDPDRASFDQIERVALVINHETAHMWFGDLVTMDWWEGIWLNEAFATFMESICTDHFRPQWKKWVTFFPARDNAMDVDGLHSTRAIEYEVVSPNDCRGMFDVLTYMKGCAVLRMLEQYLGPETFRDGIRQYLVKHAYANTVTADLWAALEAASGQPVGEIMNTWILQGGFPLVSYSQGTLTQSPFSFLDKTVESAIGERWQVPILWRELGSTAVRKELLTGPSTTLTASQPVVINAGGSGFFRTAYGSDEVTALAARLRELDELERAGLFSDTWAATTVGRAPLGSLFSLAAGLGDLEEPATWTVVFQAMNTLNRLVDDEGRATLRQINVKLFLPQLQRLGWDPVAGETEHAGKLRGQFIESLGTVGREPGVITEALKRFDANQVRGDLAAPIVRITADQNRDGDIATLDARRTSASNPQDEQLYLFAPSLIPDPTKAATLLDACFSTIRNQDAPFVIMAMMSNRTTGLSVWRAYTARLAEALEKFPSGTVAASFRTLQALIGSPDAAREIHAFHSAHPLEVGQRQVDQALERMDIGVAFGARLGDTLTKQLQAIAQ
jgi:puromycin-sensitive aminopeptidase